jgi:hypothetical protein
MVFLRQREVPYIEHNMNAVTTTLPDNFEVTCIPARRRGAAIVKHEEVDPQGLILLIGNIVV